MDFAEAERVDDLLLAGGGVRVKGQYQKRGRGGRRLLERRRRLRPPRGSDVHPPDRNPGEVGARH